MKTAKLGAIFLISVMALAGIGAGYAAWTDTITIDGTVNTGSVDINIEYLSGTWVWKYPEHGFGYWHGWASTSNPPDVIPADASFVASASADFTEVDDTILITTVDLFPCQFFMVDFLIHYEGSVPGRINDLTIDSDNQLLMQLYAEGDIGYEAWTWTQTTEDINANGPGGMEYMDVEITDVLFGYQLHYCDWILIKLWIHLPQYWNNGLPTDDLMNLEADFTASLGVIQWNEFV